LILHVFRPHVRQPILVDAERPFPLPRPHHGQDAVALSGLHNEHFHTLEPELTLYTPPQFLKMTPQQVSPATNCRRKINPLQFAAATDGLEAPRCQPLKDSLLLPCCSVAKLATIETPLAVNRVHHRFQQRLLQLSLGPARLQARANDSLQPADETLRCPSPPVM